MIRDLVSKDETLFRRGFCLPLKNFLNPDGTATSRVFKLREKDLGELSVDICSLTTKEKSVMDPNKHILFEIENKVVMDIDLLTYKAPLVDGTNDAHAVITGLEIDDDIKPALLAKASRKVIF
ncbi:MAG: hypothetical protein ACOYN5_06470 [Bacteroidales bacterium]